MAGVYFFCSLASANANSVDQEKTQQALEASLNSVKTFKARFVQEFKNGEKMRGTFYLSRPGKLRFEYDDPKPFTLVADGKWLIYHDAPIDEYTYMSIESSPASLLLRDKISLSEGLELKSIEKADGLIFVKIYYPDEGVFMTLKFKEDSKDLLGWETREASGDQTEISFEDKEINPQIPSHLFKVKKRRHHRIHRH